MTDALVFGETADIVVTDEMFSGEQIAQAITDMSEWDRYVDVSTLEAGDYDAETVEAFAKLARSLKAPIKVYSMKIRREKPHGKLAEIALRRLRERAEAGEIQPAYLYGRPE